ncbi:MAG TPA: N-acetylmuramoyl-L-alanine amidase [Vicinamibacterales bacterium]|nr:N-acetylmuramoyl-L-alanine amidase [Vicinamibacterales bacterium]
MLFAAGHLSGQTAGLALQVLSRDARRSIPITTSGSQELVALDDLASLFQLNVRDDGGAITVGYKGKTIVLTADQTIASVAGRLISLAAAPTRVGNRWLVPIDFIGRALAPVYDARLDLRRGSHLLVVGDLRVPRVAVRHESSATSARLTFDISPTATPTLTQPSAQRLVVRIDADALDLTLPTFQSVGFIQDLRGLDGTSVAIDLGPRFTAFRPVIQSIDNGTRLTIDFSGAVADTAAAPPPATPADTQPTFVSSAPGVRTVAIDAGHGGDDAGARGTAGALEKNIALAVARRLRSALEARLGVRVIMTRDDDVAVPIENRSALANNNKADLLISLHLNASFRPEVAGATTYVAAFSDADLATEGLAPERLPVFGGGLRAIDVVPWNLAQIPHRERSEQLASLVAAALNGRVPVAPRPVEHAPLRVLESANMPAVLVEMGYLTNPAQETALAGPDTQAVIAQSLLDAVVQFRDSIAPLPDGVLR